MNEDVLGSLPRPGLSKSRSPSVRTWNRQRRIFPWETMLSAATEGMRGRRPLIVVRRLEIERALATPTCMDGPSGRPKALFVRSVPAGLENWEFESEEWRVRANLPEYSVIRLTDPTLDQLVERIADHRPELIHFAGFDTWQGARLLSLPYSAKRHDGLLLVSSDGKLDEVGVGRMLSRMGSAAHRPRVVGLQHVQLGRGWPR